MRATIVLALALTVGVVEAARAQASGGRSFPPRVDVTALAGVGAGPTRSAAWAIGAEVRVHPLLALKAEYSQWHSGIGTLCAQSWPESYFCDVEGWAGLAGLAVRAPALGRIQPFAEVLAGRYSREQVDARFTSTALAFAGGADFALAWGLSVRGGVRHLRPSDDAYAELMGEDLRYTVGVLGLRYGFGSRD